MNAFAPPHTVPVFDESFEDYRKFFNPERWKFECISPNQLDVFLLQAGHPCQWSAFLLDFHWLSLINKQMMAFFLEKIYQTQIPLVIFTLGDTIDHYRKATKLGASGLLHKEKCTYDQSEKDLLAIIEISTQSSFQSIPKFDTGIENYITILLNTTTICFPVFKGFFGKNASEVVAPEAIQVLSSEYKEYSIEQFEDIIRTGVYNAHSEKFSQIQIHHLGRRFRKPEHIADDLKNREQQQPKPSLN